MYLLYPDKNFPTGEISEYKDEYAILKSTCHVIVMSSFLIRFHSGIVQMKLFAYDGLKGKRDDFLYHHAIIMHDMTVT